ncbi:hypothetical protein [Sulfitobacter guttiformis]|uniref:AAA+ family ATPase n=1 Tax=Sulfitobacter guttiformis TaxID=74349 RepID=A0A420DJY2_9RHOB|nr:hypothetical protein [Sulfitobacter guttiformis]KIN71637.1 hypothetical protein Z949_800 [Sulfitobacter guttiformis KCTC 32187]RKE94532.1 hypothetical protein C8N30_3660 [Sulfitobacter guttiformis]
MKHIAAVSLVSLALATPLQAQDDPPSLMERGAQLFFEGLMEEMSPALKDMAKLMEEAGPALQDFMTQIGPKLRGVLEEVEDWSVYEAPEVLPNGDVIIRRKPDVPEIPDAPSQHEQTPQIDL